MRPASQATTHGPRPGPCATPLERACARSLRDAIAHLNQLLAQLHRPTANTAACRREMEAIVDHTGRVSCEVVTTLLGQGLRVDPRLRALVVRCSELATRVDRAIRRAETAARQAQLEADLYAQERMGPGLGG